jgi:hypothetical protein
MTHDQKPHWDEFDALGIKAVRRGIVEHTFGEAKKRQAIHWITHRESPDASNARMASFEEAKVATDEARTAKPISEPVDTAGQKVAQAPVVAAPPRKWVDAIPWWVWVGGGTALGYILQH